MKFLKCCSAEKYKRGILWDFLTSIVLQNIETNEGETVWCNPKKFFKKSQSAEKKKIQVKNTKGGVLRFQGSGRRCFCFGRGSGVSSMFWTSVGGPCASKKTTHCNSRAHFLLECAD